MKKIMTKNQMIITALAIMLAVAGYLNYSSAGRQSNRNDQMTAALSEEEMETGLLEYEEIEVMNVSENAIVTEYGLDAVSEANLSEEAYASTTQAIERDISDEDQLSAQQYEGIPESESQPGEAVFTSNLTSAGIASNAKLLKEQTRAKNKDVLLEVINSVAVNDTQKQEAVSGMISMVDVSERETAAEVLLSAKGFSDVVVSITGNTADVLVNAYEVSDEQRAQIEDIIKRKTGIPPENLVISPIESVE